MYEQVISVAPTNPYGFGNYADFLWAVREEHDRAEEMYRRAVDADSDRG